MTFKYTPLFKVEDVDFLRLLEGRRDLGLLWDVAFYRSDNKLKKVDDVHIVKLENVKVKRVSVVGDALNITFKEPVVCEVGKAWETIVMRCEGKSLKTRISP